MQLFWQTSALRLPRRTTTAVRDRIVHAKSPIRPEGSFSSEALADQEHQEACLETATAAEIAVESRQQAQNETDYVEEVGAVASRMHVRAGLEGLRDADRGQQPTVWAVARGDDPDGEQACRTANWCAPANRSATPRELVAVFLAIAATGLWKGVAF